MSKRPNGTGCITKDKKRGTYTVVRTVGYNLQGKAIRKTKRGFATKKEAMQYVESMKYESTATVESLWDTYCATGLLDLSEDKQRHYVAVYNRLKPIYRRDISSLSILDLQRLIEPYSAYYAQKDIRTVLSHLYNIAIAQGMAQVNLSKYMRLVPHEEKKGTVWTPDELDILWDRYNAGDEFVGYILFMTYTGTMPGELRTIHRNMIDYDSHEIRGAGLKTEVRKESPIILCDKIIPVLQDLMSDSLVLWSKPKQAFYDEYHLCLARCGVPYKAPYTCRHTAATLIVNEANALVAQKFMRHSQVTTTQRYVHSSSDVLLEVANRL